jgi:uncharacterized protein (TIGR02266 family)
VTLRFRPSDAPVGDAVEAYTHDIGVGGAYIATARPLPVGCSLELEIDVPGPSAPIGLRAEVRWVANADRMLAGREPGMGVKFASLDVEALLALSDFFASLAGGGE